MFSLKVAACVAFAAQFVVASPISTTNGTISKRDLQGEGVWYNCNSASGEKRIAFSYDDGPYLGSYAADFFHNMSLTTTFFMNGYNWGCIYDYADDLRKRYAQGHIIGSHTWNHGNVADMTIDQLKRQLDLNELAFKRILGIKPAFFRFPYGSYKQEHVDYINSRGYHIIQWSVDSGDSEGEDYNQQMSNLEGAIYGTFPSNVLPLSHETYPTSMYDVLPNIVWKAIQQGYKVVPMNECIAGPDGQSVPAYQEVGDPEPYDPNTWVCDQLPPGSY